MSELSLRLRGRSFGLAIAIAAATFVVAPGRALAIGETITDVRVLDNQRTEESTVRSIAGLSNGELLEADTLDKVRERLNTSGLFADVNVWWEPHGEGVRVNIAVKDKFPWAPVPTASWSANNKSLGLLFVHGNLFGRGKQLALGGRLATVDSGATLAYRDPALFGSWAYWQLQGLVQRQVVPEYDSFGLGTLSDPYEIRETTFTSYGFDLAFGIAWLRRVKTQVSWHLERFNFDKSDNPTDPNVLLAPSMQGGVLGVGRAALSFDFRAREFAVLTGAALTGYVDYASPAFKSDYKMYRGGVIWEQGIKFLRRHNFVYSAGAFAGHDLPFFAENTAGGPNLRGYLYQQFRGDTQLSGKAEYHFPLFSIGSMDFRGLGFYDIAAVWFREIPMGAAPVTDAGGNSYFPRDTYDQRTFPVTLPSGFSFSQSVHSSVGVGLRFFLRSVAVPLIGVDVGWGIEDNLHPQYLIVIGA
jgi:outer membrane protein insertion porin family